MPRLIGVRQRCDAVYFDTHVLEAGQRISFFERAKVGDPASTNLSAPGLLALDDAAVVIGLGVRVVGAPRDKEDRVLDAVSILSIVDGTPLLVPIPAILCSVFRSAKQVEEEVAHAQAADERPEYLRDIPFIRLPGYMLMRPVLIPTRRRFAVDVQADALLPWSATVRVMLFTLTTRNETFGRVDEAPGG